MRVQKEDQCWAYEIGRLFSSPHSAGVRKTIFYCAQSCTWKTCFRKTHPCVGSSTVTAGFNIDPSQGGCRCCVKKLMIQVKNNHYHHNISLGNTVCFLSMES